MEGPENVMLVQDKSINLNGYLVIDSTVNNSTCGGIRIYPNVTLQEIKDLARAMTLKQGFIGIPRGGAKGGIVISSDDVSEEEKQILLNRFGEQIRHLLVNKDYLPGPDMGTSQELITNMYRNLGVPLIKSSTGGKNSGYFTSLSVMASIKKSLESLRLNLKDCNFAVEGFGSVGESLALKLYKQGAVIVAISTIYGALCDENGLDIPEIILFKQQHAGDWMKNYKKAKHLKKEELLELKVDVLCPCGRSYQINENNMKQIKSKVICAGANNPVTSEADKYLFKEGVLYLPHFATNCGGVIGNAMEFMGLNEKMIEELIMKRIGWKLEKIIAISKEQYESPLNIGTKIAEERFASLKQQKEKQKGRSFLYNFGLNMYRKGFIPKSLLRGYAYSYFDKMLNQDVDAYRKYLTLK